MSPESIQSFKGDRSTPTSRPQSSQLFSPFQSRDSRHRSARSLRKIVHCYRLLLVTQLDFLQELSVRVPILRFRLLIIGGIGGVVPIKPDPVAKIIIMLAMNIMPIQPSFHHQIIIFQIVHETPHFRRINEMTIPIRATIMAATIYCNNILHLLSLSAHGLNAEIHQVSQNHRCHRYPELTHCLLLSLG